jgi:(p)ppGpp synthase/HD superfamily hydrolase
MNILIRARNFAADKHGNQKRKFTGEPYMVHLEETAQILNDVHPQAAYEELVAAILHDVVEDTETTLVEVGQNFGGHVSTLVGELTSDTEEIKKIGKKEYLKNKLNVISDEALTIKLCDRYQNVSGLTYKSVPDKFVRKYWIETRYILDHIDRSLNTQQATINQRLHDILGYIKLNRSL